MRPLATIKLLFQSSNICIWQTNLSDECNAVPVCMHYLVLLILWRVHGTMRVERICHPLAFV